MLSEGKFLLLFLFFVIAFIYCFVIFFLDLSHPLRLYFDLGFLRVQTCVSLYLHMFLLHFFDYLAWLFLSESDFFVLIYLILFCYYFLGVCWFSKKRQKLVDSCGSGDEEELERVEEET